MKRFGFFRLFFAVFIFIAPHAYAQNESVIAGEEVDPQRLTAAKRFLEASNFDRQISELLPPLIQSMINAIEQQVGVSQFNEEELAEFRKFSEPLSEAVSNRFIEKKSELTELTALVYARALTVAELDALTEFQLSPAGIKFNEALPQIMAATMPEFMTAMMTGSPLPDGAPTDPAKARAIGEMLEASQFDRSLELMLDQMAQPTPPGVMPPDLPEEEIAEMDAASQEMVAQFKARKDEVRQYIASAWADKLGIEEIEAVTAFYRTEMGQQILTSLPKIFEEQQKLQERMFGVIFTDMDKIVEDIIREQEGQQ